MHFIIRGQTTTTTYSRAELEREARKAVPKGAKFLGWDLEIREEDPHGQLTLISRFKTATATGAARVTI